MENNNPLPPVTSFKLPDQGPSNSGSLFKAFSIEGITILLIVSTLLFLNYFNILPISKNVSALAFLPHETFKNTAATTTNTTNIPLPTPTPFSHKITDVPDDNSLIPIFSPDKEHVIFETPEGHDGYVIPDCTVCNNLKIALAAYNYVTGKLLMIGMSNDRLAHIFNDGKEIQILPQLGGLTISKNGQKLATWNHQNGYLIYYVNNSIIAKYPDPTGSLRISDISFSIDASKNGYILSDSVNKTSKVFIEGKEQPYQGGSLSFAPSGSNYAYVGSAGVNKKFIVLNGVKQSEYLEIGDSVYSISRAGAYTWSPDGNRLAYVGRKSNGGFVNNVYDSGEIVLVVDGKEIANGFRHISYLLFSPDSKRFAFASEGTNQMEVYLDGKSLIKLYSLLSEMDGIYFSPDSKRFVYATSGILFEGEWGPHLKSYGTKNGHIYGVSFSPDSKRLGYTSFLNKEYGNKTITVIDDKEYSGASPYRAPAFSPDSKHVIYWELINGGSIDTDSTTVNAVLDYTNRAEINFPYGGLKEATYIFSPSRATTYYYLQPSTFETEILNSFTFSKDSKYVKFNAKRGKEYWVIVLDTQTGEEIIDKDAIVPTDVPLTTITPTATASNINQTPGFTSYGAKEIVENVTAQVTKMTETSSTVMVEILIKNSSEKSMPIRSLSFQLHSDKHGTGIETSDIPDIIPAKENKTYKAAYTKLPEKPYIVKYFKTDGKAEELGKLE